MILAGDLGGTKSLLALYERGAAPSAPRFAQRYRSGGFADPGALLERFRDDATAALGETPGIDASCLAVAGPVDAGSVRFTNLDWSIDAAALARAQPLGKLLLLNDFGAAALGIDALEAADLHTLQTGEPLADAPSVVLGAGTGLGIAIRLRDAHGPRVIAGEGGHAAFAPADDEQLALWRFLRARFGRVTLEHLLSGPGLRHLYDFLRETGAHPAHEALDERDPAASIARLALERGDRLAGAAIDLFARCLGAAAGDQALGVLARGGVYLAGGLAPKLLTRLAASGFLAAFNNKGAFAAQTRRMPVHIVLNERLGLYGALQHAARARA